MTATLGPRRARPAAVLLLAATTSVLLAACTSATPEPTTDASDATGASTATTASAPVGTCDDGFMLVDLGAADDDAPALDDSSCAVVSVVGTGGTVVLDDVSTLVVEGTGTTVAVQHVGVVQLAGNGNSVLHAGEAPQVDDHGTGNKVAPGDAPTPE